METSFLKAQWSPSPLIEGLGRPGAPARIQDLICSFSSLVSGCLGGISFALIRSQRVLSSIWWGAMMGPLSPPRTREAAVLKSSLASALAGP